MRSGKKGKKKGKKKSLVRKPLAILIIGVAIAAGLFVGYNGLTGYVLLDSDYTAVSLDNGFVKLPLSDLSSSIERYKFGGGDVPVKFFVVLDSSGEPRAAFDACISCGPGSAWDQVGDELTTEECKDNVAIDDLGDLRPVDKAGEPREDRGKCAPKAISFRSVGDEVWMSSGALSRGQKYFE